MSDEHIKWTETAKERPPKDSKVIWIAPSGEQVEGTFCGGLVWYPKGSSMYVYYTPVMWRLLK